MEPPGRNRQMEIKSIPVDLPEGANVIVGQTHFIKTVEDLHEIVVNSVPECKFGLAFCEASGPCLIRRSGNEEILREAAVRNAQAIGAGHTFILILQGAYPINVLNAIKACPEVCAVFCATANPLEVIVVESDAQTTNADKAWIASGMNDLGDRLGVPFINMRHVDEKVELEVPDGRELKKIKVAKIATESAIISAAKLKTHMLRDSYPYILFWSRPERLSPPNHHIYDRFVFLRW